jgi:hypothetical protein
MRTAEFAGGGSLDGRVMQLPARAVAVITTAWGGASNHYALDDDTGTFTFTGFGQEGAAMAGVVRKYLEAAKRDRQALQQAQAPQGCAACGRVFADAAAFAIHYDQQYPGGCLPDGAMGQLVSVDGVWAEVWRYPDRANRKQR